MLSSKGYLKLIDFGTARKLKNFTYTLIGTPNFIAPEILLGKGYSFSCDYWSIGITIFFIYFGYLPFGTKAKDLNDIYNDIIQKEPEYPPETPFELKLLLQDLLNKHPIERITTFDKIKQMSLFANFPWDELLNYKIKAPYIPIKDKRYCKHNLKNCTSPFDILMENEKSELNQLKGLKLNRELSTNCKHFRGNSINLNWFNDF